MAKTQGIDAEYLEHIVYERSKEWAKILKNYENRDDGEEILITTFDELLKDEDESDNADSSMYSQCDDEAEELFIEDDNIENMPGNITNMSKSSNSINSKHTLMIVHNEEEKKDIQDLYNETINVLQEHDRKWEKAGLNQILNTFDENKIEKTVGEWLRRNNSTYSDRSLICSKPKECNKVHNCCISLPKNSNRYVESDSDSINSGDTAYYIRSSRKRDLKENRIKASCSTMTIKTYCMVKGRREELRQKYGSPDDNDYYCERMKRQNSRMQSTIKNYTYHYPNEHSPIVRRKQFRKRRDNSQQFDYATDEDDSDINKYRLHNFNNMLEEHLYRKKHKCLQFRNNNDRIFKSARREHYNHDYVVHLKPYRHASECKCCNDTKLCQKVCHYVDSSIDDDSWFVENTTPQRPKKSILKCLTKDKLKTPGRKLAFQNETNQIKVSNSNKKVVSVQERRTNSKSTKNVTLNVNNDVTHIKNKSSVKSKLDCNMPSKKTNDSKEKNIPNREKSDKNPKTEMELDRKKKDNKLNMNLRVKVTKLKVNGNDEKQNSKKTVKIKDLANNIDGTFLSNSSQICNSTALDDDNAYKRQIAKKPVKRAAADSTTILSNTSTSSTTTITTANNIAKHKRKNMKKSKHEDNTIYIDITSPDSNDLEQNNEATFTQQELNKLTPRGVLLYAPNVINPDQLNSKSLDDSHYYLTKEQMNHIIGSQSANKFFKFYLGKRRFNKSSTIYYKPPASYKTKEGNGNDSTIINILQHSQSDSDEDIFGSSERYGQIYELPNCNER